MPSLDRGNDDPTRADQIRRAEDAVNRQQFEVDRLVAQARRMGCESSGFFSIFTNPPPQCGGLNRQIDQQRNTLERMQNQLEQLSGGTTERAAQRQSLLIALGDNGCGSQYRSAALPASKAASSTACSAAMAACSPRHPGQMGGTFRTICVRSCDGYYFPISFATTPDHFRDDEQTCQRMCPAAEVQLYTYHNPGEDVTQAVSLNGRLYTELPTAFQYRKALNSSLQLPPPGRKLGRGAARSTAPTTPWRRATSSSPRRTPSSFRSRASAPTASRSARIRAPRRKTCTAADGNGGSAGRTRSDQAQSAHGRPDFPAGALSQNQKSKASVLAGLPATSEASGAGSGVPGSRKRLVIG